MYPNLVKQPEEERYQFQAPPDHDRPREVSEKEAEALIGELISSNGEMGTLTLDDLIGDEEGAWQ
jgi:hypothetical protein